MTKKILAFMASERRFRNTEKFLDIFLKEKFKDYDLKKIILKDLDFSPCISCYGCAKVPRCVLNDDVTNIYPLIDNSDLVIFASPIYFNSMPGKAKSFVDRMQVYWSRKFLQGEKIPKNKEGIGLLVGGAPFTDDQFLGLELVLKHFYMAIGTESYVFYEVTETDKNEISESANFINFINRDNENILIYKN
ncbi:flavodoxin family protein [Peptoniphilus raoultii]|uniref:flavodoxin family protein n=1 Tax=Peptoniphilus raoultii TaxID=1776387 RepID=UPI0008D96A1A|nr:flavodoxin family protein [Peptoniphilus raoultii]